MTSRVTVTRIINPCALIEVDGVALLTDPYFGEHRFFPMNEPVGLRPEALPRLDAILGGHGVFDHWRPQSMASYRHHEHTQVVTASRRMARQARRAGFEAADRMRWGETRQITPDVKLICLPGERVLAGLAHTNNHLIEAAEVSVFVGTEACNLEPIRHCARNHEVDIAILPVDGLTFGRKQLVMDAGTAIEAAHILGARRLAPIHYSQRPVRGLWTCPSGIDDLTRLACNHPEITCITPTGTPAVIDEP